VLDATSEKRKGTNVYKSQTQPEKDSIPAGKGRTLKIFEAICAAIVTAAAAFLMIEGGLFLRELRIQVDPIAVHAQVAIQQANIDLSELFVVESSVYDATQKVSDAADQQSAYWQKTQLQVYKLITDTKEIMVRTDRSLNDILVPRISASLDASTALQVSAMRNLTDTTARIDDTIDALRPMIDNGIHATAAASAVMSDPVIHETLAHVDGAAGNVDAATSDIAEFVHRETTPVRGTWNVVKKFLQEFAGPAAQVATAVK
jgi:hypothetical protein